LIGLLLIGAAVGIYFWSTGGEEEQVAVVLDAGAAPARRIEPEIEIPPVEPDAGPIDAMPGGGTHTKVIYRYVRGDWECSGDIPAAAARRVVNQFDRQIRNCYERRLKVNHTLQGRATVRVRIGSNGAVTAVQTGGSLRDPEVFSCIRNIAAGWQFPSPNGGTCAVLSAPFVFTPRP
jgi:hypothetical protein